MSLSLYLHNNQGSYPPNNESVYPASIPSSLDRSNWNEGNLIRLGSGDISEALIVTHHEFGLVECPYF